MTSGRHFMLVYGLPLAILAVGLAALVGPSWQQRRQLLAEIDDLNIRMAGISDQTEVVEALATRLDDVRELIKNDLKQIESDAGMSDIHSRLSLPIDGARVIDLQFLRGTSRPATSNDDETVMAMAATIEMDATFDSIFAVVRAAESMKRLVRVTSVQIGTRQGAEDVPGSPVLQATITLDSIFDPLTKEAY